MSTRSTPSRGLGAGIASEPDLAVDTDVAMLEPTPARPRRTGLHALISAMRPRQWIKNLLVVAAPGAAGVLGRADVLWHVILAFVAFCLLSSATYLINDVLDAHEDRRHPRKRHRAVAAGELDPRHALIAAATLAAVGLGSCLVARPWLVAAGVAYLALTFTYSAVWRHIAIVDVGAIAAGFVLRAGAGGIAAHVGLSRWFLLVVTFGALFVAFGKRYAELKRANGASATARRALALYSPLGLGAVIVASAAGSFAAYCVWAARYPGVHGTPWRAITIAPFGASLLRYGVRLRAGAGEAPEEIFFSDRWLQLLSIAWIVVFLLSVHAAG
jgi:decaprenyl-phosphate phosphoribosyltransferase